MGSAIAKPQAEEGLGLHKFRLLRVIGRGSFGKVRIVEHRASGRTYALKYISKASCIRNRSHPNTLRERDMLEDIEHPYIVNLRFSFQDEYALFMVMDLMIGGDLRFHILRRRFFEGVIRFWVAELACALHHLHTVHHIVHRDIKPDNILMDHEGHVALTDFNIATHIVDGQPHYAVAGTANYMAPEVVGGTGYTYSVDWWSLGVVMYECIYGKRPFRHKKNTGALKHALLHDEIQFPIVADVQLSYDCISAMRGLLNKDPHARLGCGATGYEDLKAHPFFAALDWDRIEAKQMQPPFVPTNDMSNFDISHDLEEMLLEPEPLTEAGTRKGGGRRARAPPEHATPEYRMLSDSFATFNYVEYEQLRAYIEAHGSISALAIEDARPDVAKPSNATLFPPPLAHLKLDDRPLINLDAQSTLSYSVTVTRGRAVVQQQQPTIISPAASPPPPQLLPPLPPQPPSLRQRFSDARRRGSSGVHRQSDAGQFPSSLNSSTNTASTMAAAARAPSPSEQMPGTLEPPGIVPIDILSWNQLLPSQRALAHRYCTKMARERQRQRYRQLRQAAERERARGDAYEFPRLASRHQHTPSASSYSPGHPLRAVAAAVHGPGMPQSGALRRQLSADSLLSNPLSLDMRMCANDGDNDYYRRQPLPPPPGPTSGLVMSQSDLCLLKLSLADAPQRPLPPPPVLTFTHP